MSDSVADLGWELLTEDSSAGRAKLLEQAKSTTLEELQRRCDTISTSIDQEFEVRHEKIEGPNR